MNFFLFLSIVFILIFGIGLFFEKFRIPWIFSALFLGAGLSIYNPFQEIIGSETFDLLANLGMYFLLLMIGFELDLGEVKKKKGFIFKATFFIISMEALLGSLLIHFVFGYSWFISIIVSLSFATVGEAILIPILEEFKMINSSLGQSIISIGVIDDLIEIFVMFLIIFVTGSSQHLSMLTFLIISILFVLTIGLRKLKPEGSQFKFKNVEILFFFVIAIFLLFIGLGSLTEVGPMAALLSGIALRTFIPDKRLRLIESELKSMAYGFFVPIFFLWVGSSMDLSIIFLYPLSLLLIVLVSNGTKVFASYMIAKNELGVKRAIALGVGLSVRFSTSIVIIKILYDNAMIDSKLYSIIIASSIIFQFVVPLIFSNLIIKWKLNKK